MQISRRALLKLGVIAASTTAGGIMLPARARAGDDTAGYFSIPEIGPGGFPALESPPEKIVENGIIRCGLFKEPARGMNLRDANALESGVVDNYNLPRLLEWIGVGMIHPEWFFGLIIVNAQSACVGVLYGYCRRNGYYFSEDVLGLREWVNVEASCWSGTTYLRKPGYKMEVAHDLEKGIHKVNIDIRGFRNSMKSPPVKADLIWREDLAKVQPLVSMLPSPGNGFTYTHKAPMPTEGTMRIGEEEITFDSRRDLTYFEDLKIFAGEGQLLRLSWNMFGGGGFDDKGRVVGIATGYSPQRPEEYWSENCLWVGDRITNIGHVDYEVDPDQIMKPWRVHDRDGLLDITATPEGGKTIDMRPLLGIYHQKCCSFEGTLVEASGEKHKVRDFYGAGEYAKIL